jgi:hypothetical protein
MFFRSFDVRGLHDLWGSQAFGGSKPFVLQSNLLDPSFPALASLPDPKDMFLLLQGPKELYNTVAKKAEMWKMFVESEVRTMENSVTGKET